MENDGDFERKLTAKTYVGALKSKRAIPSKLSSSFTFGCFEFWFLVPKKATVLIRSEHCLEFNGVSACAVKLNSRCIELNRSVMQIKTMNINGT